MTDTNYQLKFPIGEFVKPDATDEHQIKIWINTIKNFPAKIKAETSKLSDKELEKTYRPNGWTIRQVIHHCADSHMNSLIRFKLTLTENTPTIKAYREDAWAELSDAKHFPIDSSIKTLEGIHDRWTYLLENLTEEELQKDFRHPESGEIISLKTNIGIYAWHCDHHLQHIINAKKKV